MTPGIHQGIPMAQYMALPYASSGLLHRVLSQSPFHAKYSQQSDDRDDTDASDLGTAIHSALLEGIDIICPLDFKDWRTNAAKEARDQARAEGKIPMLAHKVDNVRRAVESAKLYVASSEIAGVFDSGKPEQTIIWREGDSLCKARPDWMNDGILLHVKTTQGSAQPESWIRNQLSPMGYDVAAAFYERGALSVGLNVRQHVFLVIEQQAPYGCSLVSLAPAMWDLAHRKVNRALDIWTECIATGKWPAYPSRIAYAEPMPWQLAQAEEDEIKGFDYVGDAL